MKLKVVPPVHVSASNNVIATAATGNERVIARNSRVSKVTDASADCGLSEMTRVSVVDGGETEKSSMHAEDDSYEGWSEVKSAKSPRRKKTSSADSTDNQHVMNFVEHLSTLCTHDIHWLPC